MMTLMSLIMGQALGCAVAEEQRQIFRKSNLTELVAFSAMESNEDSQVFDLIRTFFKSRGLSLAEEALRVELKAPAIADADSSTGPVLGSNDIRELLRAQLKQSAAPALNPGAASVPAVELLSPVAGRQPPPPINSPMFIGGQKPDNNVALLNEHAAQATLALAQQQMLDGSRPLHTSTVSSVQSSQPSSGLNSSRQAFDSTSQSSQGSKPAAQSTQLSSAALSSVGEPASAGPVITIDQSAAGIAAPNARLVAPPSTPDAHSSSAYQRHVAFQPLPPFMSPLATPAETPDWSRASSNGGGAPAGAVESAPLTHADDSQRASPALSVDEAVLNAAAEAATAAAADVSADTLRQLTLRQKLGLHDDLLLDSSQHDDEESDGDDSENAEDFTGQPSQEELELLLKLNGDVNLSSDAADESAVHAHLSAIVALMNDARSAQALREHSPEQYEELMTIARLAQAGGWPMPNAPEEDDEELRLRGEYEARHAASSAHLAQMQAEYEADFENDARLIAASNAEYDSHSGSDARTYARAQVLLQAGSEQSINHNPPPQHKYSEHDLATTSLGQSKMTLQNVFNGGSTVSQSDIEDSENDDDDDDEQTEDEVEEEEPHVSQHPPTDIVRVRSSLSDPNLSLYPRSADAHSFYAPPVGLPPRTKFTPAKKPATPSKSVAAIVAAASADATLDGDYALALKLDAELNGTASASAPPVYSVSLGAGDAFLPPPPPPPADDVFPPPPPPMLDVEEENALLAAAARAAALKPAIPFRPRSHPDQVTESSVSAVAYKAIASLLPPPPLAAPCYPAMSCSSPPRVNSPRDPNHSEQPAMSRALLSFDLRMIYEPAHTGYEPTPNYPIEADALIAGRYQILSLLGSAAFSDAIECYDIVTDRYVCVKIIKRHKDFFMGLDEIKLLRYLNSHDPRDDRNIVQLLDYFFFKEHIFLVSELLKENLYECGKRLRHAGEPSYFTIPRLQRVAKQVLVALEFLHSLDLVHTDLKPENILFKSYSRCEVKVIDFGSSCFTHEELSYYVQSRSYRAPEVIIGVPYNTKIDLWSLGCIIAELYTGRVLFPNDSVQTLLARVVGLFGPFPDSLLRRGRFAHKFFTADRLVYERPGQPGGAPQDDDENQEEMEEDLETDEHDDEESDNEEDADLDEHERHRARQLRRRQRVSLLLPTPVSLQQKLDNCDDELFVDFIRTLLTVEPEHRPSATEAMLHPWFSVNYENQ